ncbi:MAG: prolyl oligopeptidase family serine peptidase [Planctomycetes bacterium]|nr:prolyl oligopeptidase family serine peptidase [Planctomycetota bacterium]
MFRRGIIHAAAVLAAVVLAGCGDDDGQPSSPGVASLVFYTSSVDGSPQPYGLYVPANNGTHQPRPVVFYGHGYGGAASSTFSMDQRDFADEHDWLLVNLQGRKIIFYDGPAEIEIDDVLDHIELTHPVDRRRLFFEGASMGGTGAFKLGARQPGKWAGVYGCDGWSDFRLWHSHYYAPVPPDEWFVPAPQYHLLEAASPLYFAENFRRTPLYLVTDELDGSVWPENGIKLHEKLLDLGISHTYVLGAGGHCAGYSKTAAYEFFVARAPVDYEHVEVKTRRLWHARDGWLSIRKFRQWGRWARAEGDVTDLVGKPWLPRYCRLDCTVDNVSRLALYLRGAGFPAGAEYELYVNGLYAGAGVVGNDPDVPGKVLDISWTDGAVSSFAELPGLEDYPPGGALHKRPEQEGPVCQALCSNVMAVYGTIHANAAVNQANHDEADLFASIWASDMSGSLTVVPDTSVTPADIQTKNLVLFGTEESNQVVYDMYNDASRAFTPPISVQEDQVYVGGEGFTGSQYGVFFCYPNPLAPDRMVVVSHRNINGWYYWFEGVFWFYPDYIVLDTTAILRDCVNGYEYPGDGIALGGYFDADWGLSPRYDVAVDTDSLTYAAGSSATALVLVTVTDSGAGTPVTGLDRTAFSARIDGLEVELTDWQELGGGDYSFEVGIGGLSIAGYYISVAIETGGKYGEGWKRIVVQ